MEEKKKITKAVALKYNISDTAPSVMAKGSGFVAEKILEKAKSADLPVYKDASLVEELSKIDIGSNIPPELYEVVAQILLFISNLDKKAQYLNSVKDSRLL